MDPVGFWPALIAQTVVSSHRDDKDIFWKADYGEETTFILDSVPDGGRCGDCIAALFRDYRSKYLSMVIGLILRIEYFDAAAAQ